MEIKCSVDELKKLLKIDTSIEPPTNISINGEKIISVLEKYQNSQATN